MGKAILLSVVVLFGAALAVISLQPDTLLVERSTSIAAPEVAVFEYVNDLHRWDTWSPWAPMDPNMEKTYSGPPAGVGAVYAWKGNNKVGEGRMTITESVPNDRVAMHLEFFKPFASTSEVVFVFKAADATHTLVSWTMQGHSNFIFKALGVFINMDAAVGDDFTRGLALLKAHLQGPAPAAESKKTAPAGP